MGRILVIRGGALGDFILTLPALRLLRETYPDNHLEILGYRPSIDLALVSGHADAVRSIEYGPMAGFFIPGSTLPPDLVDYFSSFHLVISYLYDPDGYFRGNLEKAGVKTLIEAIHKVDETGDHAARQLARPLESLALFLDDPAPIVAPEANPGARHRIAIHPGSGSPRKNWPLARWTEIATRLHVEHREAATIAAEWNAHGLPFLHRHAIPLPQLARDLAACRLFLGHDTGISHLAAACDTPCVLLFGPTNPDVWAPQNPKVTVLRSEEGGIDLITPAEVLAAAFDRLPSGG
jgi:heptosyltransferase-3